MNVVNNVNMEKFKGKFKTIYIQTKAIWCQIIKIIQFKYFYFLNISLQTMKTAFKDFLLAKFI